MLQVAYIQAAFTQMINKHLKKNCVQNNDSFSQRNRLVKILCHRRFLQVSKSHLYSIRRRPLEGKMGKAHRATVHYWMVKGVILHTIIHPQIQ